MPFKSAAQRRWMFWKYPKMAKRWAKETSKGKRLPERIGKKKRKKKGNPGSKGIGTVAEREMPFLGLEKEANRKVRRLRRGRT